MARKKSAESYQQENEDILAGLDLMAEYAELGLRFAGNSPRSSGWIEAYAIGREDAKPSAGVNIATGRYVDKSSDSGETLSFFDFAAKHGNYSDWKAAREHYAKKAGVEIDVKHKPKATTIDSLEFLPWDAGREIIARRFVDNFKIGITYESLRANGARVARWPCTPGKDGKRGRGRHVVIALPGYGEEGIAADPKSWTFWNASGPELVQKVIEGKPVTRKVLTVGEARGSTIGLFALARIDRPDVKVIWKTGGPSDMLALFSIIPPEFRESDLVLTNASGESGDVLEHQAALFAGKEARLIHDGDLAGEVGIVKWAKALKGIASFVNVYSPYMEIKDKHGSDLRDWTNRKTEAAPPEKWEPISI